MIRPPLVLGVLVSAGVMAACGGSRPAPADLLILHGNVYTLSWTGPDLEGAPAPDASHSSAGWHGDAQAVAVRGGTIVFVGTDAAAGRYRGDATHVVDAGGATVLPGLVDSHTHIENLGRILGEVNLVGVRTEGEAVDKVAQGAANVPAGEWILGYGWDEGAWANRYPTMALLSQKVPGHPVFLRGLHGYAGWGNRLAFEKAGITARTPSPAGGEILKGRDGRPTGIVTNRAVQLVLSAIPAPTEAQLESRILAALQAMARGGYVMVHEAGVESADLHALERLEAAGRLPLRVYAMLSARDEPLLRTWRARGPDRAGDRMLTTRAVKAFYDGALGSRGAKLLADYADRPGQRGVSGAAFGFNEPLVADMMKAGFQVAVHAIGDAANRETLDFFASVFSRDPATRQWRHRIEHAQVLAPDDIPRFAKLGIIASMEPSHAVEDMGWAEDRLGPQRIRGAYAWRAIRRTGAHLIFNSDLPGTDSNIFYGLHSAITRQNKAGEPAGGWYPDERMSPEEALRGFTSWAAYAAFDEDETGVLAAGRWADITIADIDPLAVGEAHPARLLGGKILMTIVGGRMVYDSGMLRGAR